MFSRDLHKRGQENRTFKTELCFVDNGLCNVPLGKSGIKSKDLKMEHGTFLIIFFFKYSTVLDLETLHHGSLMHPWGPGRTQ